MQIFKKSYKNINSQSKQLFQQQKYLFLKEIQFDLNKFDEKGYTVVPDFLSQDQIDQMIKENHQLQKKYYKDDEIKLTFKTGRDTRGVSFLQTGDKVHYFYENNAFDESNSSISDKAKLFNKVGHAQHDLDPYFEKFSYNKVFANLLKKLNYKNPKLVQSMYIYKNPAIGGEVEPHVDNTYLISSPKLSILGLWIALHDANVENGCLWGIPGSHKIQTEYFMKRTPDNLNTIYEGDKPDYNTNQAVPLEVKKGTLIFWHGNFAHFSFQNYSNKQRNAYTLHFFDDTKESRWDERNWMQRGKDLPFRNYYETVKQIDQS